MDEFILGDINIDPFDVEDNLLDMDESNPNIDEDFTTLEYEDNEVDIDSPLQSKSQEQIAEDVEDIFISLLTQNDINTILVLTGETPQSNIVSEDFYASFISDYAQAVLFNPALKWYPKLLKMLPEGKFFIDGNALRLKITPQFFKKTLYPFLGDFKADLREESPRY